jgi:hypothetical protein
VNTKAPAASASRFTRGGAEPSAAVASTCRSYVSRRPSAAATSPRGIGQQARHDSAPNARPQRQHRFADGQMRIACVESPRSLERQIEIAMLLAPDNDIAAQRGSSHAYKYSLALVRRGLRAEV